MREVIVSAAVQRKFEALDAFLTREYQMSRDAVNSRIGRMEDFVSMLGAPGDYALCRFSRWRKFGYRCATFEGWVFAYEIVPQGVIVRDMSHGKLLKDID